MHLVNYKLDVNANFAVTAVRDPAAFQGGCKTKPEYAEYLRLHGAGYRG